MLYSPGTLFPRIAHSVRLRTRQPGCVEAGGREVRAETEATAATQTEATPPDMDGTEAAATEVEEATEAKVEVESMVAVGYALSDMRSQRPIPQPRSARLGSLPISP